MSAATKAQKGDLSNIWCLVLLCPDFKSILNLYPGCQQFNVAYFSHHSGTSSLSLQQDTHGGGLPLIPSTKKAKHKPYGARVDAAHIYVPFVN
jgi:hypothetical protein